jgi:hypothetical protein
MVMESKGYGFVSFHDMQDAFRFLEVGRVVVLFTAFAACFFHTCSPLDQRLEGLKKVSCFEALLMQCLGIKVWQGMIPGSGYGEGHLTNSHPKPFKWQLIPHLQCFPFSLAAGVILNLFRGVEGELCFLFAVDPRIQNTLG